MPVLRSVPVGKGDSSRGGSVEYYTGVGNVIFIQYVCTCDVAIICP